jgi:hypothetical protein
MQTVEWRTTAVEIGHDASPRTGGSATSLSPVRLGEAGAVMVGSMRRRVSKRELIRSPAGSSAQVQARSKAAKQPGARVTGSPAFSFGRNFRQRGGELRPSGPVRRVGGPKPEPAATAARGILYPFRYPPCRTCGSIAIWDRLDVRSIVRFGQ